jgi:hypothetical protein
MGHLSRSLESCVSSFKSQDSHILTGAGDSLFSPKFLFDDNRRGIVLEDFPSFFLLFRVGFCERMVSIIKDKIEFSSEMFYFKRLVNQVTLFPSQVSRRWTAMKHCFLAMFLEGGQTMKHCFLAMFPEVG